MPHNVSLITTIAAALGLALAMGFIAIRLKLPPLVGYLIAGIIIGPATPGFVADLELSQQLAEIGVMLLMFGVGLHFSLEQLLAVRHIALPGAIVQIAVATALGGAVAHYWGWNIAASISFGLALVRRQHRGAACEPSKTVTFWKHVNGRIAVGWLVVEDLAMVLVLVLLPSVGAWTGMHSGGTSPGSIDRSLLATLGLALARVAVFVGLMLLIGTPFFSVATLASGAHWLEGAFYALHHRGSGRHRLWISRLVRRILRARRILCGHGDARIAVELPRGRRIFAVQRCLFGPVLCFGGYAL